MVHALACTIKICCLWFGEQERCMGVVGGNSQEQYSLKHEPIALWHCQWKCTCTSLKPAREKSLAKRLADPLSVCTIGLLCMLMNNEFDWVAQLVVLYYLLLHVYYAIFSLLYPADNCAQENTGNTLFQYYHFIFNTANRNACFLHVIIIFIFSHI